MLKPKFNLKKVQVLHTGTLNYMNTIPIALYSDSLDRFIVLRVKVLLDTSEKLKAWVSPNQDNVIEIIYSNSTQNIMLTDYERGIYLQQYSSFAIQHALEYVYTKTQNKGIDRLYKLYSGLTLRDLMEFDETPFAWNKPNIMYFVQTLGELVASGQVSRRLNIVQELMHDNKTTLGIAFKSAL